VQQQRLLMDAEDVVEHGCEYSSMDTLSKSCASGPKPAKM
jgi:hypothetical protein